MVLFIGFSGLGTERLRREAEAAIQRVAGVDVAATIGPANLSLDSSRFLALEVQDVKFSLRQRMEWPCWMPEVFASVCDSGR